MKKYLGLAVAIGTVGMALACSSTLEGGGTDGGTTDTDSGVATTDGGTTKPDSGPKPDAGGGACYDETTAKAYIWEGPSAKQQGKCTTAQIAKLISECIDGTTATAAKCDALQASAEYSKDCDRCINGSGKDDDATSIKPLNVPVIVPITIDGTDYGLLNTDACAAAALDLGATCGNPITQITACAFGSCEACPEDELDTCLGTAEAGVCKQAIDAIKTSCIDKIDAGKATWEPLCNGGKTAFKDVLPVMAAYICGSAP